MDTNDDNVEGDDNSYDVEEINRLKSFAQSEEKVDLLSVCNRVREKFRVFLSDAGQSKDLNNFIAARETD